MRRRKSALVAGVSLLFLLAGPAHGEDNAEAEPSAPTPPVEQSEDQAENTQDETADEQAADEQQDAPSSEETFVPSENISEDISVPLPVDI